MHVDFRGARLREARHLSGLRQKGCIRFQRISMGRHVGSARTRCWQCHHARVSALGRLREVFLGSPTKPVGCIVVVVPPARRSRTRERTTRGRYEAGRLTACVDAAAAVCTGSKVSAWRRRGRGSGVVRECCSQRVAMEWSTFPMRLSRRINSREQPIPEPGGPRARALKPIPTPGFGDASKASVGNINRGDDTARERRGGGCVVQRVWRGSAAAE
jgi:hypothetical protein